MKTSLLLLLALALLSLAVAKPHNEGKRPHLAKRNREHKMNNRMEHHRREHGVVPQHRAAMHRSEGGRKNPSARRTPTPTHHDINKDIHLQHVTEHNIDKKHEEKLRRGGSDGGVKKHLVTNRVPQSQDLPPHLLTNRTPQVPSNATRLPGKVKNATKDGIPMEPERLIPVTPRPPKVHRVHHKPSPATPAPALHSNNPNTQPSPRPKAHRPPKKYSPKKHGWKKTLRKEKLKDKVKEKREKRDKKNKALHRAMAARKL